MKILIINWQDIKNPYGGGAEVHLHEIFKRIASMGHEITLLSCQPKDFPPEENIDGIRVIRHGSRNLFNFHVPFLYKKLIKNEDFDLIIDDINKIPFYTPLFVKKPLLAISHHFFGKSIYRETGLIFATYVYISEKLIDLLYKKTQFVVVSQSTLNEFSERGFDSKLFSIVQNAIEPNSFPMKIGDKTSEPIISYFGRLKKYKSVDHLVRAFAIVSKKHKNARLHILGRGSFLQGLKNLCKELNISDKVVFFGYVTEEQKVELLSKAWCMVNTSLKEGWGITNIEANACGTLVISSDVPGLRDSVKPGQSGLLYEYGNINNLSDLLFSIIENKELRNKLSDGAVEWAKTFSWDLSAKMMLDRCFDVVNNFGKMRLK